MRQAQGSGRAARRQRISHPGVPGSGPCQRVCHSEPHAKNPRLVRGHDELRILRFAQDDSSGPKSGTPHIPVPKDVASGLLDQARRVRPPVDESTRLRPRRSQVVRMTQRQGSIHLRYSVAHRASTCHARSLSMDVECAMLSPMVAGSMTRTRFGPILQRDFELGRRTARTALHGESLASA